MYIVHPAFEIVEAFLIIVKLVKRIDFVCLPSPANSSHLYKSGDTARIEPVKKTSLNILLLQAACVIQYSSVYRQ